MIQNCVICGNEVERGGFTNKIKGVTLRPLCSKCDEMCSKEPNKVVEDHSDVFERLLTERRETLGISTRVVSSSSTIGTQSPRSQRERNVVKRYGDAYLVAKSVVAIGQTIKVVGVVLGVVVFLAALLVASQTNMNNGLVPIIMGAVAAAVVGLLCYLMGVRIAAEGQTLQASLDSAVNSSPFLTNDLRAEMMSV